MPRTKKADQKKDADKNTATAKETAGQTGDTAAAKETAEQTEDTTDAQETAGQTGDTAAAQETAEQAEGTTDAKETPEQAGDTATDQETAEQTGEVPAKTSLEEAAAIAAQMETVGVGKLETGDGKETEEAEREPDMFANLPNPCVYCGPTVRGVARQYTTYQGGITDTLRSFITEHPEARQLIVSTAQFPAMRKRLDTPGTAEAKLYKRVKEQLTGSPRKPSEAGFVGKGGARERT